MISTQANDDTDAERAGVLICEPDNGREATAGYAVLPARDPAPDGTEIAGVDVFHNFSNVLTGMVGYAEMARAAVGQDERVRYCLGKILEAGARGREMVAEALDDYRTPHNGHCEIRSAVTDALAMVTSLVPQHITFTQRLGSRRGQVGLAHGEIAGIVLNLCMNAVQAMHQERGELRVELYQDSADDGAPFHVLRVSDTGPGIRADALPHIFEPYFTTKYWGQGTGLGLTIVKAKVAKAGGTIRVAPQEGEGAVFEIRLPDLGIASVGPRTSADGRARILLVDDEASVLHYGQIMLARMGHHATTTDSAQHALELMNHDKTRFDLLITDMVMEGLNGLGLLKRVRASHPALPIVLISGYELPREELLRQWAAPCRCVRKPFSYGELSDAIADLLQESSHGNPTENLA